MKQVVTFDKLKLTNNQLDDNGHVGNGVMIRDISTLDLRFIRQWMFRLRSWVMTPCGPHTERGTHPEGV
jgi:hypothetical protein